ncbi:MAG: GGDEF domain-containing protein [Pirellulales bacterium]
MSEASQLPIIASLVLACVVLVGIVVVQALRGPKGNSLSGTDNLSAELTRLATSLDPMDEAAPAYLNFARSLVTKGNSRDRAVIDAFSQILASHTRLQEQLFASQQRLSAQARQMDSHVTEARTDALTHVANRRALDDFLLEAAEKHKTEGTSCSMMLVDVDYFKKCNDTYGHHAGDEVLRQVAAILSIMPMAGHSSLATAVKSLPSSLWVFHASPCAKWQSTCVALLASAVMRFESKQLRVTIVRRPRRTSLTKTCSVSRSGSMKGFMLQAWRAKLLPLGTMEPKRHASKALLPASPALPSPKASEPSLAALG